MAMKWLILYARRRNEKSMAQRLVTECLAAKKLTLLRKEWILKNGETDGKLSHF
jgi:ribosomal protein S7